eukprot:m.488544 g.488544  ORF g.488544 m.488544 type:complete len:499 (-) comp57234_c0_seq12:92-1588(-)
MRPSDVATAVEAQFSSVQTPSSLPQVVAPPPNPLEPPAHHTHKHHKHSKEHRKEHHEKHHSTKSGSQVLPSLFAQNDDLPKLSGAPGVESEKKPAPVERKKTPPLPRKHPLPELMLPTEEQRAASVPAPLSSVKSESGALKLTFKFGGAMLSSPAPSVAPSPAATPHVSPSARPTHVSSSASTSHGNGSCAPASAPVKIKTEEDLAPVKIKTEEDPVPASAPREKPSAAAVSSTPRVPKAEPSPAVTPRSDSRKPSESTLATPATPGSVLQLSTPAAKPQPASVSSGAASTTQTPKPSTASASSIPSTPVASSQPRKDMIPKGPKYNAAGEELFCVCRLTATQNDAAMVQCDTCEEWYHFACIEKEPTEAEELFICSRCQLHGLPAAPRNLLSAVDATDLTKHIKTLMKEASLFNDPVTDDIAPGYSAVITRPMCFSDVLRNLSNRRLTTLYQFNSDVLQIFENCRYYNVNTPEYVQLADKTEKSYRKLLIKFFNFRR